VIQKATHPFAAAEPSSTWGRTGSGESPEATTTRGSASSPPAGSAEKQLQPTASPADAFGSTPPQASVLHNQTGKKKGIETETKQLTENPIVFIRRLAGSIRTWGPREPFQAKVFLPLGFGAKAALSLSQ